MKKFIITSVILVLVAVVAFSVSLYHYVDINKPSEATPTQVATHPIHTEPQTQAVEQSVPALWQDDGMFSDNYDKAYAYVQQMSTEQMVGQLLLATCHTDETAQTDMSKYALSGYLYTSERFSGLTADGIKQLIASYNDNAATPMIMAVTEEGGYNTTLSDLDAFYEYSFSSYRETFATGGMDAIRESEQQKALMLRNVGINLNLAPVCDMAVEQNQIMYSRSLGGTTDEVCEFVSTTTELSQTNGVSVALKHFPGYGTNLDTLEPVVVDSREVSEFEQNDFKPFESGIGAGAHFVMMSNVLVEKLDPTCIISLSDYAHTVLKDRMGFTGLVITDNLDKADYSEYAGGKSVYVQAVLAGNDLLLVDNYEDAYLAILSAVNDGTIDKEDLQRTCMRIIAYKYTAGIMK